MGGGTTAQRSRRGRSAGAFKCVTPPLLEAPLYGKGVVRLEPCPMRMNSICADCRGCRAGEVPPAGAGPPEGDKGTGRLSGGALPRNRAGAAAGLAEPLSTFFLKLACGFKNCDRGKKSSFSTVS